MPIKEAHVEDFPIWLKLIIYITLGSTVLYVIVNITRSILG
jgi:hypothetical protein